MLLNKGVKDEVLILNEYGIKVLIFELIDHINKYKDGIPVHDYPTKDLLELRRCDGINRQHLSTISNGRIEQPVLASTIGDSDWIIDGNHRLLKRAEKNIETTKVIVVPNDVLMQFMQELSN